MYRVHLFSSVLQVTIAKCISSGIRGLPISPIGPWEHRHIAYHCCNGPEGLPFGHVDGRSVDQILTVDLRPLIQRMTIHFRHVTCMGINHPKKVVSSLLRRAMRQSMYGFRQSPSNTACRLRPARNTTYCPFLLELKRFACLIYKFVSSAEGLCIYFKSFNLGLLQCDGF